MKKALLSILLSGLLLSLSACEASVANPTTGVPSEQPHIHNFGQWSIFKEATCSAPGEEIRICECGEQESRSMAQLAHTYGEWFVNIAATCAEPGKESRNCDCGIQETREIPFTGHSYAKTDQVEPTPDNPVGSITYGCTTCGDTYTEQVTHYGSEGLIYKVMDTEGNSTICKIVAIGSCTDPELIIPKYIDGYKVVEIGKQAFLNCETITSVVMPDSIITIGDEAFHGCDNLKSVSMQDGVLHIGDEAFHWCRRLSDITIPGTVQTIGVQAFRGIDLANLVIPDSVTFIDEMAFESCDMVSITLSKNITILSDRVFNFCLYLTNIEIPDGVTEIGYGAFYNCNKMTSVTIPSSVIFIDDAAFRDCSKLTEIRFLGTIAQWNAIQKGTEFGSWAWDDSTGYYTVYCTDGQIEKNVE